MTEKSAAVCEHCYGRTDMAVINQLLTLRRQVRDLYEMVKQMRDSQKALREDLNEMYDTSRQATPSTGHTWQ